MKAFIKTTYGGPEVLRLADVANPKVSVSNIVVKVMANSANPADWHILRGKPYFARLTFGLFKPKNPLLGADFAGIVVEVGERVKDFKAGDYVFGEKLHGGAFAEYISINANECALMPKGASFQAMAGVPIAGLTALQALITHGNLKKGETVLVNGAAGGVGHFIVQIAKAYSATVTAVCSSQSADFVRMLGADNILFHDKDNIHLHQSKYNLVIDAYGNLNHEDYQRMGQRGVMIGFTNLAHILILLVKRMLKKSPIAQFTVQCNKKDLETLASLVQQGVIKTYIEHTFSYQQIPEAIRYIEAMKTKGKVIMSWENPEA